MTWRHSLLAALCAAALHAGCAPDLRDEYPFDGDTQTTGERIRSEDRGSGVTRTHVDASSKEAWVYFDMDAARELPVAEALELQAWELSFQRFKILTNSGVSGPGMVQALALENQPFDALTKAPADGYQADEADGPDGNSDVDSAFLEGDGWYAYDLVKHRLAARDVVYVVKTGEGRYFKLKLLAYYDETGTAGRLSFDWAAIDPP